MNAARVRALVALIVSAAALCGCERKRDLVWMPETPPASVLIRNVGVLDVAAGTVAGGRDVLLSGGRIVGLGAAGTLRAAEGATVVEGTGATLLPGLIDMHGHISGTSEPSWLNPRPDPERNLRAYLYAGVTTVLDLGGLTPQVLERRDAIAAGTLLGPQLYAAGPMVTVAGGHPIPTFERIIPWYLRWYLVPRLTREVRDAEHARQTIRDLAALRPDVVKLAVDTALLKAPRISNETLHALVDEARKQDLRAVAHIGSFEDARDAAAAGAVLWAHGVYKERLTDDQVRALAAFRIPMVPTLYLWESYSLMGQQPRVPTALERETVDAEALSAFDAPPPGLRSALDQLFAPLRPLRPAWRENVRRLRAAGVTILAGSDPQMGIFPGAGLHRELALLTEAGLTPAEAIRAATLDAARFLANAPEPDFGVVAEGKRADLVLVDGDPTADLAALSRIRTVFRNGIPLERRALTPAGDGP